MHEVELANRVLEILRRIASEHRAQVLEADLRIGELNGPRSLRLWLRKLGGDEFRSTKFRVEVTPLTIKCECGYSGPADSPNAHLPEPELGVTCPKCGGREISISSGRELEVIKVRLQKRGKNDE
ncbi:MAG: hydrogenase/urease maturation nickel metallochaperone HypA [Hadesarchaea archaeon]|nr:hydrogenase/urease maturation nickel metallochaperone HypA [Hadesarchaea archaeon]